jgi:hypothetical protein
MTRLFLVSIAVVSVLAVIPSAVIAQEETPETVAAPEPNQVYVKLIMPTAAADREKERPVVESWIAKDLKKRGQARFTAVTGWVPLDPSPLGATDVWEGGKLGDVLHCPVGADIPERAKGRIKVHLVGWNPGGAYVTVSLRDEPGRRAISAVEYYQSEHGMAYVAVLIAPPPEKPAAPTGPLK